MKQLLTITIVSGLLAIALCACDAQQTEEHSSYLMSATVAEVADGEMTIVREDGHIFTHEVCGDHAPQVDDIVCCWYDTNDTKQVEDDELISMSYSD